YPRSRARRTRVAFDGPQGGSARCGQTAASAHVRRAGLARLRKAPQRRQGATRSVRHIVADRVGRLAAVACAVAALSGCIAVSSHPDYPVDGAQPDEASVGNCPLLAGTYADAGELAEACVVNPSEWKDTGLWGCNTSLARNLGLDVAAERVSIEQPDEQTLVVVAYPASGEPKRFVLGRGDRKFACDATGLAVSKIGSVLPWWANV